MSPLSKNRIREAVSLFEDLSQHLNDRFLEFESQHPQAGEIAKTAIIARIASIKCMLSVGELQEICDVLAGNSGFEKIKGNKRLEAAFVQISREITDMHEARITGRIARAGMNNLVINSVAALLGRITELLPARTVFDSEEMESAVRLARIAEMKSLLEKLRKNPKNLGIIAYCQQKAYLPTKVTEKNSIPLLLAATKFESALIKRDFAQQIMRPVRQARQALREMPKTRIRRGRH
jgi:hypothetical protein